MSIKTYIQPKTGIEKNAIQHGLKQNLEGSSCLLQIKSKVMIYKTQNLTPFSGVVGCNVNQLIRINGRK